MRASNAFSSSSSSASASPSSSAASPSVTQSHQVSLIVSVYPLPTPFLSIAHVLLRLNLALPLLLRRHNSTFHPTDVVTVTTTCHLSSSSLLPHILFVPFSSCPSSSACVVLTVVVIMPTPRPFPLPLLLLFFLLLPPSFAAAAAAPHQRNNLYHLSLSSSNTRLHTPTRSVLDLSVTPAAPPRPLFLPADTVVRLDGAPRSFATTPVAYVTRHRAAAHTVTTLRLDPASDAPVESIRVESTRRSVLLLPVPKQTNSANRTGQHRHTEGQTETEASVMQRLVVVPLSTAVRGSSNSNRKKSSHSGHNHGKSTSTATTAPATTPRCDHPDAIQLRVRLSVAFDTHFCHTASSSDDPQQHVHAVKKVHAMINSANSIYSSATCVHFHLSHIDGYCNSTLDPYVSLSAPGQAPDSILSGFVSLWTSAHSARSQDLTFFLTGSNDGSATAGRAFLSGVCSEFVSFGYCEGDSALVFSHELGHSLGANHDSEGLMNAVLSQHTYPVLSRRSLSQIVTFVDRFADCLKPEHSYSNSHTTSKRSKPSPPVSPTALPSLSPLPSSSGDNINGSAGDENDDEHDDDDSALPIPDSPPSWSCSSSLSLLSSSSSSSSEADGFPYFPSCTGFHTVGYVMTSAGAVRVRAQQIGYTIKLELAVIAEAGLDIRISGVVVRPGGLWISPSGSGRRVHTMKVGLHQVGHGGASGARCCGELVKLSIGMIVTKTTWNGAVSSTETKVGFGNMHVKVHCVNPCRANVKAEDGRVVLDERLCPVCEMG